MSEEVKPLDIKSYLREKAEMVNAFLASYFENPAPSVPPVLNEAMRYSMLAGGKRVRPILAIAAYEACGGRAEEVVECASALEVIHTYSLIHDDLPAMDNDDLRRGRPTNHRVYGEAVAILAGDGLLTEAFLMILNAKKDIRKEHIIEAIRELSVAAGPRGMVGGQVQDILSEDSEPDPGTLRYIHTHKTGALIRASVRLGGILAGADRDTTAALTGYGENLGLAFQVVDDILDVMGDAAVLGKPVGSDAQKKKMTYPALYGVEASRQAAEGLVAQSLDFIKLLSRLADPLREIAGYIVRRSH